MLVTRNKAHQENELCLLKTLSLMDLNLPTVYWRVIISSLIFVI